MAERNSSQYGGYGQGGGYGQSNPYGQQSGGYGGGGYGGGDQYNDEVEMGQYNQPAPSGRYGGGLPSGPRPGGAGGFGNDGGYEGAGYGNTGGSTGGNILNQCREIDQAIDDLEGRLEDLRITQSKVLGDRASHSEIDRKNRETLAAYKNLGERLKKIKSNPESGSPTNAPQVGRVDRKLKKAINDFQRLESEFRKNMQNQQVRQILIVDTEIQESEARQLVEDPNFDPNIFQQSVSNEIQAHFVAAN
jgi:syntaxin 1B/2/3